MKVNVKNLKISFPTDVAEPSEEQMLEWLTYELGISKEISITNPLVDVRLTDCAVIADRMLVDDKEVWSKVN